MRMSFQQNTPTNVNKNPLAVSKFKKKKEDCKSKVKQSNHLTFLGVIHIFINHLQVVFFTVKMFFSITVMLQHYTITIISSIYHWVLAKALSSILPI